MEINFEKEMRYRKDLFDALELIHSCKERQVYVDLFRDWILHLGGDEPSQDMLYALLMLEEYKNREVALLQKALDLIEPIACAGLHGIRRCYIQRVPPP